MPNSQGSFDQPGRQAPPRRHPGWAIWRAGWCGLAAGLIAGAAPAGAEETAPQAEERFHFSGFGTLGMARSDSHQAGFVRDLTQPDGSAGQWTGKLDSLLGLQASWQFTPQLEAVVQGVSRYHYNHGFNPELMWAYLRYEPNSYLNLRLGRLGTDFYLYADSRQVGYSYLTVRPNPDYFVALPFSHLDGADAEVTVPVGPGLVRAKVFTGRLDEKLALADRTWDLAGSRMWGGHLTLSHGPWTARLGRSYLRFAHDLPLAPLPDLLNATQLPSARAAAEALGAAGKSARFDSLGVVYDQGPLLLQFMLSHAHQDSAVFQSWWAGYLQAGYRIGEFTPYAGYSRIYSTPQPIATGLPNRPPLNLLNAATAATQADSHSNQATVNLGLRWDFARNMDLKVQWDAIRGHPDSLFPVRGERAGWNGRTNVLTLTYDFVF